ncbi:STYKc [Seminavis robusta]|uniref:STYKc n=1 Tax=Seminavis robusta TaxID=568900 RepID=A0A9N8DW40_9STRA|nr:STYKc [Seminavis robusta]|eukprot:Sro291_g109440.1 STYKc (1103) ;mRNA; f:15539-18981
MSSLHPSRRISVPSSSSATDAPADRNESTHEPPAIVAPKRHASSSISSSDHDLQVALPKKSPLAQRQVHASRRASCNDTTTSSVRRTSAVNPENLAGFSMSHSQTLPESLAGTTVRDASERLEDDVAIVAVPKKSPLRHQMPIRRNTNSSSNSSSTAVRRSSLVEPKALLGLLEEEQPSLPDQMVVNMRDTSERLDGCLTTCSSAIPLPKKSPLQAHIRTTRRSSYSPNNSRRSSSPVPNVEPTCLRASVSMGHGSSRQSGSPVPEPCPPPTSLRASVSVGLPVRRRSLVDPEHLRKAGLLDEDSEEEDSCTAPDVVPRSLTDSDASSVGSSKNEASDNGEAPATPSSGLRLSSHSSSSSSSAASTPRSSVVDSDSKIKAGLRRASKAVAAAVQRNSVQAEGDQSRTNAMLEADAKLKRGLRQSRHSSRSASMAAGLGRDDDSKFHLRVARTHTDGSSDTAASSSTSFAANDMRPGAYSAVTASQGEFSMERVDSLRKGGVEVLGRESINSAAAGHDVSIDLSSSPSLLDLEQGGGLHSTNDPPLFSSEVGELYAHNEPKPRNHKMRVVAALAVAIVVAGILVAATVGSVLSRQSDGNQENASMGVVAEAEIKLEQVFVDPMAELASETIVAIQFGTATDPRVKAFKWIAMDPNLAMYSSAQRRQRFALASFFYATNGPAWFDNGGVSSKWLDYDAHECSWFSLAPLQGQPVCRTAPTSGQIPLATHYDYTSLVLSGSDLWTAGSSEFPNPTLQGILVPELGMLTSLNRLDLGVQKLRGTLPESLPPTLTEIVLYDNELTGTIDPVLYSRTSQLWLSFNAFAPSTIPSSIGPALTSLALTESNIAGSIPKQLFASSARGLEELYLSGNSLSGSIPSEVGLATNLRTLELHINQLSSSLPSEIGDLSGLQWLSLQGNKFSGTLISELGKMSSLEYLHVSNLVHRNKDLQGTIPLDWFALPNLKSLALSSTKISGSVPSEVGLLTSLESLILDNNGKLSASVIPSEVGALQRLTVLGMSDMNLHSSIPSEVGLLSKLTTLRLHDNELTGGIPQELESLSLLELFKIDGNAGLLGTVPTEFCAIDMLDFGCGGNGLCGCDCPCSP